MRLTPMANGLLPGPDLSAPLRGRIPGANRNPTVNFTLHLNDAGDPAFTATEMSRKLTGLANENGETCNVTTQENTSRARR
jgi:hypothetical protein